MSEGFAQQLKEVAIQSGPVTWKQFMGLVRDEFSNVVIQGPDELCLCWVVGFLVDLVAALPLLPGQVMQLCEQASDPSPA